LEELDVPWRNLKYSTDWHLLTRQNKMLQNKKDTMLRTQTNSCSALIMVGLKYYSKLELILSPEKVRVKKDLFILNVFFYWSIVYFCLSMIPIQPTISLEMPVPSQGHYVFTVFRLFCYYPYVQQQQHIFYCQSRRPERADKFV
jgi:hypothetical protein